MEETAKAWNLPINDISRLAFWIDKNISKDCRSFMFTKLLRRKRDKLIGV
jgi:hypothetical protein